MRSQGKDIVELFGYRPNDVSDIAREAFKSRQCPFTKRLCTKTDNQGNIKGVCAVTNGLQSGEHDEVIICPKRLYQKNYGIFEDLVREVWDEKTELVIGGELTELRDRALKVRDPAIAFGQHSGVEIGVNSFGRMSLDWVIQRYHHALDIEPGEFIGVEIQSIDTTTNYRDVWHSYSEMKQTGQIPNEEIPNSEHGLNWANVHKRLIPQIIRKGNVYRGSERCVGFYFIAPEVVYQKFEEVIGKLPELDGPAKDRLSIKTYSISEPVSDGQIRDICPVRTVHLDAAEVAQAFISNVAENASAKLDRRLATII